jgi:hypothetical protein
MMTMAAHPYFTRHAVTDDTSPSETEAPYPPPTAAEAATEAQASGWFHTDRRQADDTQDAELRGFDLGQQIGYTQGWHWGVVCGVCVSIVVACAVMAVRGWVFPS